MRWIYGISHPVQVDGYEATDAVTALITLGRDREAAKLGAENRNQGETMDPIAQLEQLGAVLPAVVGGISADQLANPTPCVNFTVAGVLEHMVSGATAFAAAFRGEPALAAEPPQDVLGAFGPALGNLVEAIASPGALERTVAAPFGAVSGDTFARFVVLDGLVHGWDLALATGQRYEPADSLVAAATEFALGALDPLRDGDTFADPQPVAASATPIERLAALTGRTVPPSNAS